MSNSLEQRKDTIINILRKDGPKTTRELIDIIFPDEFRLSHHYTKVILVLNRLKHSKLVTSKPVPYESRRTRRKAHFGEKIKMVKLWTLKK